MRLINTKTLELHMFSEYELPPYAILSHTWGNNEVSLQDLLSEDQSKIAKPGYEKILKASELAKKDGFDFLWVDTCCIDKSSSAELSEAINSMFRWYGKAEICYALLSDVSLASAFSDGDSTFSTSRWFTRGWTLQELLAPKKLIFLSQEWRDLGSKHSLVKEISDITGITQDILQSNRDMQSVSISCRMSWTANRRTTRAEDIAYCLMGIFNINMPMLYGEGEKAFIRLQEEIIKSTEDQTIFIWEDEQAPDDKLQGLLAPHPRCFHRTGNFHPSASPDSDCSLITVTNRGIILNARRHTVGSDITAMFECTESSQTSSFAFVYIRLLGGENAKVARIRAASIGRAPLRGNIAPLIVKQNPEPLQPIKSLIGESWFSFDNITLSPGRMADGPKLAFFKVTQFSDVRSSDTFKAIKPDEERGDRPLSRITKSPSDCLFQVPTKPNQIAVTLHITAPDSMGFGDCYHAEINIGSSSSSELAILTIDRGEGDEEYEEDEAAPPEDFSKANRLPATMDLTLEKPMTISARLAWKNQGSGSNIACISLSMQEKSR